MITLQLAHVMWSLRARTVGGGEREGGRCCGVDVRAMWGVVRRCAESPTHQPSFLVIAVPHLGHGFVFPLARSCLIWRGRADGGVGWVPSGGGDI